MSRKILADILQYLEFLESQGLRVCLSNLHERFRPLANQSFPATYHLHPLCNYFRGSFGFFSPCSRENGRLRDLSLTEPTYLCCDVGVEQWVIPLMYQQERLVYVLIYGYRDQLPEGRRKSAKLLAERGEEYACWHAMLSTQVPSRKQVLSFVQPLQYMFEALYQACREPQTVLSSGSRELYLRALNYIQQKYMNHLTLQALAGMLKCSESYLKHLFRTEGNTTVHAAIRRVRLERAEALLRSTRLSITHIATRCGFSDSNYFSVAFRKHYGLTPTQFRAQHTDHTL